MTQGRKPAGNATPESLFLHCETTYKAMLASARARVVYDDVKETDDTIIVWEGMLTQFITGELHLSVPYYTKITQALKRMGCIRQLKRGGGTAPSQWELIKEPTLQAFHEGQPAKKQRQGPQAAMQQQLDTLNSRVLVLERAYEKVIEEARRE